MTNAIINGRYILHNEIGEGGMGVIYLATDRLIRQQVALKQIKVNLESLGWLTSLSMSHKMPLKVILANEFQILASLQHPNIISVLDYGFDSNNRPFYVMDYVVDAETILEAGKKATFDEKMELFQQLLQALIYLHRQNILHRDLKPNNVLVDKGRVRLVDFGLSSYMGQDVAAGGTLLYISPEVLARESLYLEATDLYSVGVMMYEILAGEHPFDVTSSMFAQQVIAQPPNLEKLEVDAPLAEVVGCLLAKKPQDRYESARACLFDLNVALGETPTVEDETIRESFLQAATFVGRDSEMKMFTEALSNAKSGSGSAWLLGGESGVGKSRFLRELQTTALVDGFQLLRGQGIESGSGETFQLWREPLKQLLVTVDEIDNLAASVLLALLPDIGQLIGRPVEQAPELGGEAAITRLFTTISRLLLQAERPLLILLEDIHWVSESLLLLPYLAQRISHYPIMIVGSYRHDERPDLPKLIEKFHHVILPRLSKDEMSSLSVAMLGDVGRQERIISFLQQETEGNSFFAVELLRLLADQAGRLDDIGEIPLPQNLLPKGIKSIVEHRIAKTDEDARPFLQIAATASRYLDPKLLRELTQANADQISRWIEGLADISILNLDNGQWQFSHDKIRVGVLETISKETRRTYHGEIAEGIEVVYGTDNEQAGTLAYHWGQNGNQDRELFFSTAAGKYAFNQYAFAEAAKFFDRALLLTDPEHIDERYQLLIDLEKSQRNLGTHESQKKSLDLLEQLSPHLSQKQQMEVVLCQINYYNLRIQLDESFKLARNAIEITKQQQDMTLHSGFYAELSKIHSLGGDYEEAERAARKSYELALEHNVDQVVIRALELIAGSCYRRGLSAQALEWSSKMVEAIDNDLSRLNPEELMMLGHIHSRLRQLDQAQYYYEQGALLAQKKGMRIYEGKLAGSLALVYLFKGELESALKYFHSDLEIAREVADWAECEVVLLNLAQCYQRMGLWWEVEQCAKEAFDLNNTRPELRVPALQQQAVALFHQDYIEQSNEKFELAESMLIETKYQETGLLFYERGFRAYLEGEWDDMYTCFRKAYTNLSQLQDVDFVLPGQVALAICYMHEQEPEKARAYISPVMNRIQQEGLDGDWSAAQIGLLIYRVFHYLGDLENANEILTLTYAMIQEQSEKLKNDEWRKSFLENVAEHREISHLYHHSITS